MSGESSYLVASFPSSFTIWGSRRRKRYRNLRITPFLTSMPALLWKERWLWARHMTVRRLRSNQISFPFLFLKKKRGQAWHMICGLALTRSLLWKKSTCQVQILIAFQELGRIWTGHWQVPDPMIFEKRELVDQPPQIFLRKWAVDYGLDKFFYFFPNLRLEEIRTCPKTIAQPIIILWSRRLGDKSLFLSFSRRLEKERNVFFSLARQEKMSRHGGAIRILS